MLRPLLSLACAFTVGSLAAAETQLVYFGTYTNGTSQSRGLYVSTFDPQTGVLSEPELAAVNPSPSFLAIHPSGKFLYTAAEDPAMEGDVCEASAFRIIQPSGRLELLNRVPAGGLAPCFIAVDATGKMALSAQYNGGNVSSFSIAPDGTLTGPKSVVQHHGTGPDPDRQEGPHAHTIRPTPDNRFALACDLGADRVFVYAIDPKLGTLRPHGEAALPKGAGPRHLAFHPNGKWVFVNNELLMSVSTFAYDAQHGTLKLKNTVSTLPPADQGVSDFSTAEIVVHPNGRFVYVSNRTHDTLSIFSCDKTTGTLTLLENVPVEGEIPRNFALDLTGNWLLAAHQNSGTVAVFKVNAETGGLKFTGQKVYVEAPVCVRFLARK
jgi:6-phosphogluconolactonase